MRIRGGMAESLDYRLLVNDIVRRQTLKRRAYRCKKIEKYGIGRLLFA